jgi:carboxymethylenebutenolidase
MMTLTAADGHKFRTFEAGNVNAPRALVVVQEIFGVNEHIRSVAERLAGYGYRVLAPAMFDRVGPDIELDYTEEGINAGREARAKISDEQALLDLEATADALAGKPVGIIGYCWGGTLAWDAATQTKRFRAASCWYGGGIAAKKAAKPNCPVQMHFGAEDHSIPMHDVEAIKAAQPGLEVLVYAGAQHGFGCEARASYSAKDWELAELRSLAFFAEHLR